MVTSEDQATLRKRILAERRALGAEEVAHRSAAVVARFFHHAAAAGLANAHFAGMRIGLYQALPGELSLRGLEEGLVERKARLYFPRLPAESGDSGGLELVELRSDQLLRGAPAHPDWQAGPYGIRQPHPELPTASPGELDLIVVPGVVFGMKGERIGMGGGHYDRFLARVPNALRLVLAFDFQLFDRLGQNPWDQAMDWVVTERREARGPRASDWIGERTGAGNPNP